ncbi:STIL-like protein [Mya arenaria]|uniref:STIL-like protein n=1 Tax=Mya arenaria TaxID=6604 RepID=A0ABY7FMT8_MYAAR|nr:STIL-like protein [Mya arenaria]
MATPFQVQHIPDSIRAQYASKDLNAVQMAREVPRQYQRNAEDGQILRFPSTKNVLWDHETLGKPQTLHISSFRKPSLRVSEKILRFAQRHVDSSGDNRLSCVLIGSLDIDDDNEGVVFNVERLDLACDPNTSTSHAAGDTLIPFTIQCGSKERGSTEEDYISAIQLLKQRCQSKAPVVLGSFLLVKAWCSYYSKGDTSIHHLEFEVVTLATEIQVTPITAVPIVPTALSKNLAGPMSISHMQGTPKTGYLTMDHTRKLLLVLESDPKVTNLPLVGIWVSGISYVYSPYVWACCLRYLHNASISDRVCSPPDPFLLVLYNPTHSKPEFYECCTASGDSKMSFDFYTGFEAVQINKAGLGSTDEVVVELSAVKDGAKLDLFRDAVQQTANSGHNESRRSISPDPVSNEDITPRIKPAPHQSRLPMMQSMVPEVSLFFGNEDTTFVPNVQHPSSRPQMPGSDVKHPPIASSTPMQTSNVHLTNGSVPNDSNSAHQLRNTVSANNYMNFNNPGQNVMSQPSKPNHQQNIILPASKVPHSMPASYPHYSMPNAAPVPTSSGMPHPHHHPQPGYPGGSNGMHPCPPRPYCSCPSCPKPPTQFYNRPQQGVYPDKRGPYPRPQFSSYGPPPPRLNGPPYQGYPAPGPQSLPVHQQGVYPPVHHSYPPSTGEYTQPSSMPYSAPYSKPYPQGAPSYSTDGCLAQSGPVRTGSSSMQGPQQSNQSGQRPDLPPQGFQEKHLTVVQPPQASGGVPIRAEERRSPRNHAQSSEGLAVSRSNEVQRSNQSSDNSGRSSDDSGLSFTPEKHNSPAQNASPKQTTDVNTASDLKSSITTVNWENVPPEIYQLLMRQEQQLKTLQAQIEVLTAQSLNNTAESTAIAKHEASPAQKCTVATNTSLAPNEKKEQVSACMQTSQQEVHLEYNGNNTTNPVGHLANSNIHAHNNQSSSSGSGCDGKTPMEIRHRGRLPMNSTRREEGELDMSQGELVALMNNMHDRTIDSVQSEMIVDLPSFQSSPTRSPRSQESYANSSAFNLSPRSPISASMCENQRAEVSDTEETDEEDNNTAGTDNPEYYNRLMDNIKKLLSQNSTENTLEGEGYSGDVSSDPSTHINYVSMLLDSSDTDTSMEINAMAMKYLKDEQLTQLTKLQAKNRLLQGSRKASEKTALLQKILKAEENESTPNVTTVGMSPNDLTFATKKYLERHGLLEGAGDATSASDSTQNDSYRLRTNYSTMTSGSDDGPAQVTHEVLSTPASRGGNFTENSTPLNGHTSRNTTDPYSTRSTPSQNTGMSSRAPYNDSQSIRTYNDSRSTRSPYNDSQQNVGFNGTPKPNHTHSRLEDHNRVLPNRPTPQNMSEQQSHNYTPYSDRPSPFLQSTNRNTNTGAGGGVRYASPQITPTPNMQRLSPPERDSRQPQRSPYEQQGENRPYINTEWGQNAGTPVRTGLRDNGAQQRREETDNDDRILDITRLKQLSKLL